MRKFFSVLVAAAMLSAGVTSAHADISDERNTIRVALEARADQSQDTISDIRAQLRAGGLSRPEQNRLRRDLRLEMTRLRQIASFSRIINRYPRARLRALAEYFDLPVSRS